MTENELYTLVIATINAGLASFALGVPIVVRQAFQPRVQGTPDGAAILLSNVNTRRYGFLARSDVWVDPVGPVDGYMRHTETQAMQVKIQCNALSPPSPPPAGKPAHTAADLVSYAAAILQSDVGRLQLQAAGVGIERVTDIRQPNFKDERDQFEASPSFDFTLDFNWSLITKVPIVDATELRIVRV